MSKTYETIKTAKDDGIFLITLNRPEKLNAFNTKMMFEMMDAFDTADADDEIGAVIMTGAGRAYCAGADLSGGGATFDWEKRPDREKRKVPLKNGRPDYSDDLLRDGGGRLALRIFASLKPVIAAINGPAVGVGITMCLPADIRIASDNARFGFIFSRRALVPEACSSWFLPRLVGISKALEWCYRGDVFEAPEALAGGLVRSLHKPQDLLPEAKKLARQFADNTSPVSQALIRQALWQMLGADHPMEAHKIESRGIFALGRAADVRESIDAFLKKRPPKFSGKVSKNMPDYFPWWKEKKYS